MDIERDGIYGNILCGVADDGINPLLFLNSEMSMDDRKKGIALQFESLSGLGEGWTQDNPERVIIELDTSMFNFKLPKLPNDNNSPTEY